MSSKKEEERNEKIIRGLMKLPPNRRCINCNSVGPQYVCTTFWTFVCLSCSGIHREFTHRVKSVSMAKFTKQEVDALQEGGNQRAREIYLKNWDMTCMRLPDSSNPDRIRDFIRSVYVNKKYAGERSSENPLNDAESLKANESDLKRPNSYHSFSQSPPYDYQYEERRYGKNSSLAPRRLASDRGYEGKVPSFLFSPGRAREHTTFEDRFANESSSRHSDFSVSSAGEQFRYDTQSPNSQGDYPSLNASYQSNRHPNARPQRTSSSGSFGSFDSNSIPESTSEQFASGSQQLVVSPSSQRPPLSGNQVGSRPGLVRPAAAVNQPPSQQPAVSISSDTSIDLFAGFNEQNTTGLKRTVSGPPVTSQSEPALVRSAAAVNQQPAQQPAASTPDVSVDLFAGFNEQNMIASNRTAASGPALTSPGPALISPAISFNQPTTQQSAASTTSDTYVDLFAGFNEQNTTGLNRTVSAGLSVTSPTELDSSFNQLPRQQPAASTHSDTSVDLFAGFNVNSTTGVNRTVSAGPTLMAPTDMDLFAGFNNQPPEVKDEGWANFNFSEGKQVAAANAVIQSPPVVISSGNDLTSGMLPVNSSNALPYAPQTASKEPHMNQERSQPWNAFGESSNSDMYVTNNQWQMPLPQESMSGLGQTAVGHSALSSSLASVGVNEVAKLTTPSAVQLPVQKPVVPVSAQLQSVDWFASAHDPDMLLYQGISQDFVKSDTHNVAALNSLSGATSLTRENLASLQPLQSNVPVEVMGTMSSPLPPLQPLQGKPYQAMPSTNPFDFPDDSDLANNMFMNMNSIQAALPRQQPAADYYNTGAFQSEFYTQNPTSTYASQPQGNIQQMIDQVPNPQIRNPTSQVYPTLGSNPFA